jgi:hypothetical protein
VGVERAVTLASPSSFSFRFLVALVSGIVGAVDFFGFLSSLSEDEEDDELELSLCKENVTDYVDNQIPFPYLFAFALTDGSSLTGSEGENARGVAVVLVLSPSSELELELELEEELELELRLVNASNKNVLITQRLSFPLRPRFSRNSLCKDRFCSRFCVRLRFRT